MVFPLHLVEVHSLMCTLFSIYIILIKTKTSQQKLTVLITWHRGLVNSTSESPKDNEQLKGRNCWVPSLSLVLVGAVHVWDS